MLRASLVLVVLLCSSLGVSANPTIGMPTGSKGGTYFPMGADIATLATSVGINIDVKKSAGSLDNIRRMSGKENAGISIVQSDVIEFLSSNTTRVNTSVLKNLKLVFPLYNEEVHLLANKTIKSLEALKNKRVVVGKLGSGTFITANNILNIMDIKVSQVHDLSPKEAYQALLLGKVDAVFFVGGKPIKYITGLLEMKNNPSLSGLMDNIHLVPLDNEALLTTYAEATIKPTDYISLDGGYRLTNNDVPTVAVQAVLVAHDFGRKKTPYYKMRCEQINQIDTVVRKNLDKLASGEQYHPKWANVDLDQSIPLEKSSCIIGDTDDDATKQISCYLESGSNCGD